MCVYDVQDLRACVEQLQVVEKEVLSLELSQKELADTKDHLDEKRVERIELHMKREVWYFMPWQLAIRTHRQQRLQKQLSNAHNKLERAQRHAEDKKVASQQTLERLQREYEEMVLERRENDNQVEDLRVEANSIERKVRLLSSRCSLF